MVAERNDAAITDLCLRCNGCGELFVAPTGRREPWSYMTPDAQTRLADFRKPCDACDGTGIAKGDSAMLEFLHVVLVNLLGTMPYQGMSKSQRSKHKAAYETAWALWGYFYADGKPEPLIRQALEEAVREGRVYLGWDKPELAAAQQIETEG